jgi:predicted histone-like DNA-binding protein
MTVKFNVVARGKPGDKVTPQKFYLSVVATGKVDLQQVAKMAADVSTGSPADTAAVIGNSLSIVTNEIARGTIVQLGDFRSLWLRTESDGETPEGDVRNDNITNVLPRFSPEKRFQQALDAIEFEKAQQRTPAYLQ